MAKLRRREQCNILTCSCKVRGMCQVLTKCGVSRQICLKFLSIKFKEILPVGVSLTHAHGRTDGHDTVNRRSLKQRMQLVVERNIQYN